MLLCQAVVLNQPEDSVDYLGRWLLKYVDNFQAESDAKEERYSLVRTVSLHLSGV